MQSGIETNHTFGSNTLNVLNGTGVWTVLRDHLVAQSMDSLPLWFAFDFVRIRTEVAPNGDRYSVDANALDKAYSALGQKFPEIDASTLDAIKQLESQLTSQLPHDFPMNAADMSPYERACLHDEHVSFFQLYAGAIRRCTGSKSNQSKAYKLGASLAGPLFYGYVHRVLRQAEADGIKCLYFLARDGQLLLEIAKVIKATLGFELELKYLYVSRKAMRFPSILRLGDRDLEWIFEQMDNQLTLATIAMRLRMSVDAFRSAWNQGLPAELAALGDDEVMNGEQADTLRKELKTNRALASVIESHAAQARAEVLSYFEQEGLFDYDRAALVDVGWKGTLQDSIYRIVASHSKATDLIEYYFGTSAYSGDTSSRNRKIPFFIFPTSKPGLGPYMELLLLADHGMTLGYVLDDVNHYQPVTNETGAHVTDWGLEDYFEGVRDFSRVFSESLKNHGALLELHYDAVVPFLMDLLDSADLLAAEVLGEIPYSGNQEDSNLRRMAPSFGLADAFEYLFASNKRRAEMTRWREASYARSSRPAKLVLRCDFRLILTAWGRALLTREEARSILNFYRK